MTLYRSAVSEEQQYLCMWPLYCRRVLLSVFYSICLQRASCLRLVDVPLLCMRPLAGAPARRSACPPAVLSRAAVRTYAQKFVEDIGEEAMVLQDPKMAGNTMSLMLAPNTAAKAVK